MLHKPPQVVATMNDPERRPSLRAYVQHIPGRMFPIGRLEFSGSGLLLLTSDGDLASRLLRVARRLSQTYWVKLNGRLSPEAQRRVEDFAQAQLRIVRNAPNPWYEARFTAASRDRLRRALAEEKLLVEKFLRTGFAGLELGDLPAGGSRPLTPQEIGRLERATNTPAPAPTPARRIFPSSPAVSHAAAMESSNAQEAPAAARAITRSGARQTPRQDPRPAHGGKGFRRSSPESPSRRSAAPGSGAIPHSAPFVPHLRDQGKRNDGRPDSRRPHERSAGRRPRKSWPRGARPARPRDNPGDNPRGNPRNIPRDNPRSKGPSAG
jgi:23S rRNA pseudouridine2605 synthase